MKRQSNTMTLGQLPTFADYRRMRLLQPRRDFPTPDKEVQEQVRDIKVEEIRADIEDSALEGNAVETQETGSSA